MLNMFDDDFEMEVTESNPVKMTEKVEKKKNKKGEEYVLRTFGLSRGRGTGWGASHTPEVWSRLFMSGTLERANGAVSPDKMPVLPVLVAWLNKHGLASSVLPGLKDFAEVLPDLIEMLELKVAEEEAAKLKKAA
jgi:hypothetical protein